MAKGLTERQEIFCQAIMQGKSDRQACYEAYPKTREWKPESVDSRAYHLKKSNKVLTRLSELQGEAKEASEITRNELIEQLKSIGFADLDIENIRPTDKIKALEALAKILGYDKPQPDNKTEMGILPKLLTYLESDKEVEK